MSLRQTLHRHRKDQRLIVGGLAVLLLLFTATFYVVLRERDLPAFLVTNRILLFVLWYVNVVLILSVLFVLLRNLFKLLIERRARILGSKFKFKLVATYIGLSLIPVLALFAIATELLQGSIDRWFNTPLRSQLERGSGVAQALYDRIEQENLRAAGRVRRSTAGLDPRSAAIRRRLEEMLADLNLDLVSIYEGSEFVWGVVNPQSGIKDLPEPRRAFLEEAVAEGEANLIDAPPGGKGTLVYAAVADRGSPGGAGPTVLVVATLLDPAIAERTAHLINDFQTFRQIEVQKDDLRASHLLMFLMVTLVILLASSWVGLYLARRVTVPIQGLAEGMRRISGGDLRHRVDVAADDELGVLVDSFNRMTEELADNKDLLESGYRELTASNERLAAERALIDTVLQSVAAGVVAVDSTGRILTCNEAALGLLRQSAEEVVGRPAAEAWQDPDRRRLLALLPAPGEAAGPPAGREVHLVLGGEWKTFEVKVTDLEGGSGPHGRVLVIEDLTELIKAQQLAAWNEAARRIAHEIKNPLTPIRLAAERILKKHRQGDRTLGRAVEDGVEIIVREVSALTQMVDEFSRYARMPRPNLAPADLPRLLDETILLYQNLKPGVGVSGRLDGDLAAVRLDAEQIKRALINLLDNAVEATEAPGEVAVSIAARDGHLAIRVADSGRGIPPEARDKLFLPYYSTKGRGTGLGLAIVNRIVTDHLGTIRVEDNEPRGTVFTIELPVR